MRIKVSQKRFLRELITVYLPVVLSAGVLWMMHIQSNEMQRQTELAQTEHGISILLDLKKHYDVEMRGARSATARALLGAQATVNYKDLIGFFQMIGALVETDVLDRDMVWSVFGYSVRAYHQALKPFLDKDRVKDPTLWQDAYDLVGIIEKIESESRRISPAGVNFSHDDLFEFLKEEAFILGPTLDKKEGRRYVKEEKKEAERKK